MAIATDTTTDTGTGTPAAAQRRYKYTVVSGRHSRDENGVRVTYKPGDAMFLTRDEAANHGVKVRPFVREEELIPEPGESAAASPWAGALEGSAADAVTTIHAIEDAAALTDLLSLEEAGRGRKTVLNAIRVRQAKLAAG